MLATDQRRPSGSTGRGVPNSAGTVRNVPQFGSPRRNYTRAGREEDGPYGGGGERNSMAASGPSDRSDDDRGRSVPYCLLPPLLFFPIIGWAGPAGTCVKRCGVLFRRSPGRTSGQVVRRR